MTILRRALVLAAVTLFVLPGLTQAAEAPAAKTKVKTIPLTISSSLGPEWVGTSLLDEFLIPEIDAKLAAANLGYKIDWRRAYGGTLTKPGSESQTIKAGKVDLGLVMTAFEPERFPLQQLSFQMPFVGRDLLIAARLPEDIAKGLPAMADAWDKNGLVYLGGITLDSFQLYSKAPMEGPGDLKGRKVGIIAPSAPWLKGTGATPVVMSFAEMKPALVNGTVDTIIAPSTVALMERVVEVAPNITVVDYGGQYLGALAMSKKSFAKLPEAVQKIIKEVGWTYMFRYGDHQAAIANLSMMGNLSNGGRSRQPGPNPRKEWADALPNIAQEWAAKMDKAGLPGTKVVNEYMGAEIGSGQAVARDWRN